jgi:hypothetical protein
MPGNHRYCNYCERSGNTPIAGFQAASPVPDANTPSIVIHFELEVVVVADTFILADEVGRAQSPERE